MAKLIVLRGDQHRVFELTDPAITIGRAPDNALWLDDPSLSRRHCEIKRTGNTWSLKDLGSFNGTFLNNLACEQQVLKPGDRIQIGTTVCYYVSDAEDADQGGGPGAADEDGERAAREAASRKLRNFMSLLEITKAVNSELSRQRLLTLVVQKSIELVQAQRGFLIILRDGKRVFEVALHEDGSAIAEPEKVVSTSVLETVTKPGGEPVMTINAQNDLGGFMSIVALEVRSLICVPLKSKERVVGALYVDSQIAQQQFGDEALNLLQAFGDQATIALENATLYDAVLESREQEKRVRQVFQRYVPKDVVNQVLNMQEGARLSSKQRATVLFSDIRSFTSISERLRPEEVVGFLNDYLQRMVDIVFAEGGIVDKFVGDAVMAVWGAPATKPDDARRSVRAALKMLAEVERFNQDQRAKGGVEIEIGIGLHTGEVIAGNMGSDKKMEYTVIGDTVNVASRVEGLNKPLHTRLLITKDTLAAAGEGILAKAMAPVDVKGKAEKLLVYEVTGIEGEDLAGPAEDEGHFEIEVGEATIASVPTAPKEVTPPPRPAAKPAALDGTVPAPPPRPPAPGAAKPPLPGLPAAKSPAVTLVPPPGKPLVEPDFNRTTAPLREHPNPNAPAKVARPKRASSSVFKPPTPEDDPSFDIQF